MENKELLKTLIRIAEALDRMCPPRPEQINIELGDAFIWHGKTELLELVTNINAIDFGLLKGIEYQQKILLENTKRFALGFPANNVLLWGARGTGKSSLIKSTHSKVNNLIKTRLGLIEIHREDLHTLPRLLKSIGNSTRRILIFCDDLSFDNQDTSYKSLLFLNNKF